MRGTDCTPEQIVSARAFLANADKSGQALQIGDERLVTLRCGDIVRLVAWYGALRFQAGRDGTGGTLEAPGELDVVRPEGAE